MEETTILQKIIRLVVAIWELVKNNMLEEEDKEMIDSFMDMFAKAE